jgi:hypothetical protein
MNAFSLFWCSGVRILQCTGDENEIQTIRRLIRTQAVELRKLASRVRWAFRQINRRIQRRIVVHLHLPIRFVTFATGKDIVQQLLQ